MAAISHLFTITEVQQLRPFRRCSDSAESLDSGAVLAGFLPGMWCHFTVL
jgi:hypothetical protein